MNKTVQLATKPKRAAPKAKYIDPIVQATFNKDGTLQEIVKALNLRLRDDNPTVVLKSLIVLHTLMRGGSLEPTFSYLVSSSPLSSGSYSSPNTSAYAAYLVARTKSYSNLNRDVIRDKSDRKAANRLRQLGVEQGLLREVRETQRMIAALVEAKFYLDDIDDDVAMTALRLLVKDLLVLFTAVNEGVINVLEHYFEMSHVDATTALKIYKTFCKDTEKVVAFLGVAKKLHNILNVPIPNLKHAPVSLVHSLEEYLNDPNFAANREEYKENKRIADGGAPAPKPAASTSTSTTTPSTPPSNSSPTKPATKTTGNFTDFFESIEASQTSMFNPSTESPSTMYFQQQATFNPFLMSQPTGMPFGAVPGGSGFIQPQMTGNPFLLQQQQQQPHPFFQTFQPTGFAPSPIFSQPTGFVQQPAPSPFGPFGGAVQPQMTGFPQPLQAQTTGFNPFRQSMMPTGNPAGGGPFGNGMTGAQTPSPFGVPNAPLLAPNPTGAPSSPFGNKFAPKLDTIPASSAPTSFTSTTNTTKLPPLNSSLTPKPSVTPTPQPAQQALAPLTAQKTGARNPFNPSPEEMAQREARNLYEANKGPSLNDLATGNNGGAGVGNPFGQSQGQPFGANSTFSNAVGGASSSPFGQQPPQPLTQSKTGGLMGNIANEFAFTRPASAAATSSSFSATTSAAPPLPTSSASSPFGSTFSSSSFTPSALSSFPTSSSTFSSSTTPSFLSSDPTSSSFTSTSSTLSPPIRSQSTGFAGSSIKPFQPTSSFGSKLADEFGSSAPSVGGFSSSTFSSPLTSQTTGTFNPFRSSTLPPLGSQPTGAAFGSSTPFGGSSAFGGQPFGGQPFGASSANGFGQMNGTGGQGATSGSLI